MYLMKLIDYRFDGNRAEAIVGASAGMGFRFCVSFCRLGYFNTVHQLPISHDDTTRLIKTERDRMRIMSIALFPASKVAP